MNITLLLLVVGFVYSVVASFLAYRESGDKWMLVHPTWIDKKCGISAKVRMHGKIGFAVLFAGTGLFLFQS